MRLATTTGDFDKYCGTYLERVKQINQAGFKYIDYGFGGDYANGIGIFSDDPDGYIHSKQNLMFYMSHLLPIQLLANLMIGKAYQAL